MNKKLIRFCQWMIVALISSIIIALIISNFQTNWHFSRRPIALATYDLFDLGVVDANGDNNLDVFTVNHSAKQSLKLGNGKGEFKDVLSDWNLDQDRYFPGLEDSLAKPEFYEPGLYIYRQEKALYFHGYNLGKKTIAGVLKLSWPVTVEQKQLFDVDLKQEQRSPGVETTVNFTARNDGWLVIRSKEDIVEIPHKIAIDTQVDLKNIHLGVKGFQPNSHNFNLMWRDRHSMAWADWSGDGQLDVFIGRGGIKGKMNELPEKLYDELFVNQGANFVDLAEKIGLNKNNCPGRQSAWVDYNQDHLLDLYYVCGRGSDDPASYPNQLLSQVAPGKFEDVAPNLGLDLARDGEFLWLDSDHDQDLDLLAIQDNELAMYTNEINYFSKSLIGRFPDSRLKKFSLVDYDLDGNLDIYVSGRKQNFLVVKENDRDYKLTQPSTVGLPNEGLCGNWVDYDNDGLADLYAFPNGLYHQNNSHLFEPVKVLVENAEIIGGSSSPIWGWSRTKIRNVRCSWFDYDNDGARDLILSTENVASLRERILNNLLSNKDSPIRWKTWLIRNQGFDNHWIEIILHGSKGNYQAIGTTVRVTNSGETQTQQVGSSEGSYFSQGHYRLYFGLGKHEFIDSLEISWFDGRKQIINQVQADQVINIEY